jgi:hypothetical protein
MRIANPEVSTGSGSDRVKLQIEVAVIVTRSLSLPVLTP